MTTKPPSDDDEDSRATPDAASRKLVLARRAKFVAAAMTSVTLACGKTSPPNPEPCLAVPFTPEPDAAPPQPCLSVAFDEPDAARDAGATTGDHAADAGALAATDAGVTSRAKPDAAAPRPPVTAPTRPMPCLSAPITPKPPKPQQ